MKRKILSILIVSLLSFCFVACQSPAQIDEEKTLNLNQVNYGVGNEKVQQKLNKVLSAKVQDISQNQVLLTKEAKSVMDFNGEEYIVTECMPSGYTIYHPESGNFVETSPTAPSPYKDLYGELYYAGPTEYYVQTNDKYRHTVTGEIIDADDLAAYEETSTKISMGLSEEKDDIVLQYIENSAIDGSAIEVLKSQALLASSRNSLATDRVDWFKNLYYCGYTQSIDTYSGYGCCGFIALNMIYAYFDKFIDNRFIDDIFWRNSAKTDLKDGKNSFSFELHRRDPKDGTTSMHIDKVSKNYLKSRGITNCKHTDLWTPFFTKGTIKKIIDNGYPVIIFGNLANPPGYDDDGKKGGHAVVAYSYSGNDFTCHYGWHGYSEVTIKGTFGSIYAMELK